MGWKSVKEHYRIRHDVMIVPDKGFCIGSPYIHDIIVVSDVGEIVKRYDRGWSANDDLARYQSEIEAEPGEFAALLAQDDQFERSIPVYTCEGSDIIECACEEPDWPNVTHDGRMMYENTFSADRAEVVRWAIRSAKASIKAWTENVAEAEKRLTEAREHLTRRQDDLARLTNRSREHE